MIWQAVVLGAAACYLAKLAGLSVPARVLTQPWAQRTAILLPAGVLAALVVTQTFAEGTSLVLDARAAGVAVAALAVVLRAPFLVVVGVAALTTALLRLLA